MTMTYYLGLDNGGTTTKASIFSAAGEEIATVSITNVTEIAIRFEREWKNCSIKWNAQPMIAPSARPHTSIGRMAFLNFPVLSDMLVLV